MADVDALLASLPAGQLWRWMAFDELEPFGEIRADFRAGIIAASNTNLHLPKGKKALSPLDFMPFLQRDDTEPSPSPASRSHVETGLMALLSGAGQRAEAVRADLEKHHG
ncbi:phage tail assembly protein T [Jeongeupia naejangsanensis]|uniref:DUF4035 domain-containing protein n=1 Tax=Jeongeupia naejangsanensis TaxID=613195 RepID=A0ABS2BHI2_9NEIS|nr:DUF4035 domain-containing protein [Jeongeupia naejangsanensis]MBM3114548.1 DUF4035 domain-containing protein [Jeongeupia naejangsanensis]